MELVDGILVGLGALRQGEQRAVIAQIDPLAYGPMPANVKPLGNIVVELSVQLLGDEFILTLQRFEIEIQAPCSTCGHKLLRQLELPCEHTAVPTQKAQAGNLNLQEYLRDLLMSLLPESLPCVDDPCNWREDVDLFMEKSAQQKPAKAFHPFKALFTSKKWNSTQE